MNWKILLKAIGLALVTVLFGFLGCFTAEILGLGESKTSLITILCVSFIFLVLSYFCDLMDRGKHKTPESGMSEKPTAEILVARLVPEWGHRLELLHKVKEPYEHYSDSECEEVPTSAIESWQEVEI